MRENKNKTMSISVAQYYIHQILCLDKLFQFINFSAAFFLFSTSAKGDYRRRGGKTKDADLFVEGMMRFQ